ncbi:type 4a pilus biogenesis protein PilO [Desulforamulus putei]|uniref:type 4a pilus biogenesis protein PilO n=1 Tax=Desulforamulus putei TaxID=74701 RepID=UPI002FDEA2CE
MIKMQVTPRDKKILIILLSLMVTSSLCWFVLFPQIKEYRTAQELVVERKEEINHLKEKSRNLEKEIKALEKTKDQFREVNKKFATNMQDGLFIVNLDRKLKAENVAVGTFRPLEIQKEESYYVLPVEMIMAGEYNKVISVMDFLENQVNLTELRDIRIINAGELNNNKDEATSGGSGNKNSWEDSFSVTDILALIGAHEGYVGAKFILMIYSQPTPEGRLVLEDIKKWKFGRENPFKVLPNPNPKYILYPFLVPIDKSQPRGKVNDSSNTTWLPVTRDSNSGWLPN